MNTKKTASTATCKWSGFVREQRFVGKIVPGEFFTLNLNDNVSPRVVFMMISQYVGGIDTVPVGNEGELHGVVVANIGADDDFNVGSVCRFGSEQVVSMLVVDMNACYSQRNQS